MSVWASGDTLTPSTLNRKGASASSTAGFSTNTLAAESGSIISVANTIRAGVAQLRAAANASGGRDLQFLDSSNNSLRWLIRTDTGAESGSNTGSPWELVARDDAGVGIDSPIQIGRPITSAISLARVLYIANNTVPGTPTGGGILLCRAGALLYLGTSGSLTTVALA